MGGGGGHKPPAPRPTPLVVEPEVEKQRKDVKERLKGGFARRNTRGVFGDLAPNPNAGPVLLEERLGA